MIERKIETELKVCGIRVVNQDSSGIWIDGFNRKHAEKILEKFPRGRFKNSRYDVRFGPFEEKAIGPNDDLRITRIGYDNGENIWSPARIYIEMDYQEYVKEGRRNIIPFVQLRTIG